MESFNQLQQTLNQIEDSVQNARRYYNAVVRDFNTKIAQFPSNILANMFGFKPREFFEISAPAEREVPKVSFGARFLVIALICDHADDADNVLRTLRRFLAVMFFSFLLPRCSAARPAVGAATLVIQHFDERVTVNADGTIEVTEIIDAKFTGSWNGIYRTIPIEYTTPQGLNYTLFLEPLSITDDNAHALKYEQSRQGRYTKFKIYVPDANDATRTVIIRYRILNAIRFFDDHDELYWNVTGDEWDVPIESATAHIELPAGITGLARDRLHRCGRLARRTTRKSRQKTMSSKSQTTQPA